jgi:hypothetical protein
MLGAMMTVTKEGNVFVVLNDYLNVFWNDLHKTVFTVQVLKKVSYNIQTHFITVTTLWNLADWWSSNASDLYSGGSQFQFLVRTLVIQTEDFVVILSLSKQMSE